MEDTEYWWKNQETVQLQTFLEDDVSTPAYKNNNFDSWRDDILEMEVTIDDNGADLTAFRFDIAFDNDLITWVEDDGIEDNDETSVNAWSQGNSRVIKGSHISGWTEGDESSNAQIILLKWFTSLMLDTQIVFKVVVMNNQQHQILITIG